MIKIIKDDNFEENKQNFLKSCDENPKLKEAYEDTTFEVGRKILIEVEITDRYLSSSLMSLLSHTSKEVDGKENLGFKVNTIHARSTPTSEKILQAISKLYQDIQNNNL